MHLSLQYICMNLNPARVNDKCVLDIMVLWPDVKVMLRETYHKNVSLCCLYAMWFFIHLFVWVSASLYIVPLFQWYHSLLQVRTLPSVYIGIISLFVLCLYVMYALLLICVWCSNYCILSFYLHSLLETTSIQHWCMATIGVGKKLNH